MQCILLSNILEHSEFHTFIAQTRAQFPRAHFLVMGDLLNIFPEPGENLDDSIFYEIYGELLHQEMDELIKERFKDVSDSAFIKPLQEMFMPTGKNFSRAESIAEQRYYYLLKRIQSALQHSHLYYIPGNMDYPRLALKQTPPNASIHQIDESITEWDGVKLGGIGGIPNNAHPFRGITEISPYEMVPEEYNRRLKNLQGVDVLMTHISPQEYSPLRRFLAETPVQLMICRAPFNLAQDSDFRGKLAVDQCEGKTIIYVRPFDFPINQAYLLTLKREQLLNPTIETITWEFHKTKASPIPVYS